MKKSFENCRFCRKYKYCQESDRGLVCREFEKNERKGRTGK